MILFKQIKTKEQQPTKSGWYNTEKGLLFYWKEEEQWSCRDERISEEYPTVWYEEVMIEENPIKQLHNKLYTKLYSLMEQHLHMAGADFKKLPEVKTITTVIDAIKPYIEKD
jgi:hypothetical protein